VEVHGVWRSMEAWKSMTLCSDFVIFTSKLGPSNPNINRGIFKDRSIIQNPNFTMLS
jgi:hypothetical protein